MKRSEINQVIKDMEKLAEKHRYELPPFVKWKAADWAKAGHEYDEIRDNKLGWDITDFGLGEFVETGLSLITLRNGNQYKKKYSKPYAEKILMLYPGQSVPMHYHWSKMEDIIIRGGGEVYITVYNGAQSGARLNTDVTVHKDGKEFVVSAGTKILLMPGESISIPQYMYHDFIVPKDEGQVLLGEVSMCNDDENDNRFYESVGRFPEIEEDQEPYRLLCNEYPVAK